MSAKTTITDKDIIAGIIGDLQKQVENIQIVELEIEKDVDGQLRTGTSQKTFTFRMKPKGVFPKI